MLFRSVPSAVVPEETVQRAEAILRNIGMKPITLRAEIPAHVGDRLLEAVWREALWLIKDGVATTEQIDRIVGVVRESLQAVES